MTGKPLRLVWSQPTDREFDPVKNPSLLSCALRSFRVGGLVLPKLVVRGCDVSEVNKAITEKYGEQPVNGMLGADVLAKYKAIIDYSIPCLYLRKG